MTNEKMGDTIQMRIIFSQYAYGRSAFRFGHPHPDDG